jgi:TetR/AcrR family fatty acid metabolism transcriptional regulator
MNRHSTETAGKNRAVGRPGKPGPARDPEKRARILEAAIQVFARKGFFGAKVAEIADLAGVADGTIYLYFRNKHDLLISLFEERMDALLSGLRGALEGIEPGPEKLRACIDHLLAFAMENPDLMEVFTVELRQSAKFMKEYSNPRFKEYLELVAGLIDEGQRQGRFRSNVSPPVVARALYGAMDELCLQHVLAGKSSGLPSAAAELREIFIQGLLARGEGEKS